MSSNTQLDGIALDGVIDEVKHWPVNGRGCFTE